MKASHGPARTRCPVSRQPLSPPKSRPSALTSLVFLLLSLIVLQEWLQGCYEWLTSLPGADPTSQKFLDDVVAQLLQSDLTDSMLQGTGIPIGVTQTNSAQANSYLGGTPILVEIVAITEIGTSAYQLEQIRATREERMRLGQTEDGGEDEADLEVEGEGPVPRYPRGMLRFDLSDGSTTINAIEFRPIPEIILGQTQLGYKVLFYILALIYNLLINFRCFLKIRSYDMVSHSWSRIQWNS